MPACTRAARCVNFHTDIDNSDRTVGAGAERAVCPTDIVVREAAGSAARFPCPAIGERKTYRYTIDNSRIPDVFRRQIRYHHPAPLNLEAMEEALAHLVGEHDFTSFCSKSSTKRVARPDDLRYAPGAGGARTAAGRRAVTASSISMSPGAGFCTIWCALLSEP